MNSVFTWPVRSGREGEIATRVPPAGPVLVYLVATTIGGAAVGFLLALAGHAATSAGGLVTPAVYATLAVILVVSLWEQRRGRMRLLPERKRQVPSRWLQWRRRDTTAAAFGLMIGTGILTFVEYPAAYVLGVTVLMAPSVLSGAALGAIYGCSRGAVLVATWIGDRFLRRRPDWHVIVRRRAALATLLTCASVVASSMAGGLLIRVLTIGG